MKALLVAVLGSCLLMGCEPGNVELPIGSAAKGHSQSAKNKFAMVSTPGFPGECLPGVVRSEPWGEQLATIPSGTLVWVGESKSAPDKNSHQPKKWFRVRFYQEGTPISGWMHSNILKLPVWKEPVVEAPIDTDLVE